MSSQIENYNLLIAKINMSIKRLSYSRFNSDIAKLPEISAVRLMAGDIILFNDLFNRIMPVVNEYDREVFKVGTDLAKARALGDDLIKIKDILAQAIESANKD